MIPDYQLALENAVRDLFKIVREIARYGDKLANEHLALTGSYGGFDEPGSVQIAREALEKHADIIGVLEP